MIKFYSFFTAIVTGKAFTFNWTVAGAMVVSAVVASEGAKDAASAGAGGQEAGIEEQRRQFDITQKQLAPYQRVAIGDPVYGNQEAADAWLAKANEIQRLNDTGVYDRARTIRELDALGEQPSNISGYTGGALNRLADYGRSQVDEGQYIPNVDPFQFNLQDYKDPGYDFRVGEAERGLNRNAAGMGKLLSGNRLRGIMDLNQEMASQE